ncbi:hypothetical protein QBC44DRAFT_396900 [Cladorrhinum sp. PSN332]|nr:hypothetical protein QBC44DRAFT_396900 [Cladorrhinum sp. PSN332]
MDTTRDEVQDVLSLIEDEGLPYPSSPLLASFVTEALNPVLAARYVKGRLLHGEGSSLVANWSYIIESITENASSPPPPNTAERQAIVRRDGNRCCVTGKPGILRDPLIVAPILPLPSRWTTDRDGMSDMLGAFFGPPYRDWWLFYAKNPDHMSPYSNHWLVRRSAAKVFAHGLVKLDRRQPSMVEYTLEHVLIKPEDPIEVDGMYPLLGDHSREGIEKVDPRFIGTHARLCKGIQFLEIQKIISSRAAEPPRPLSTWLTGPGICGALSIFFSAALLTVWRIAPSNIRFAAYGMLHKFGSFLYGQEHPTVQRLPLGLYLKYHDESGESHNEFNALRVVRRHTSVPTPSPLDLVSASSAAYFLTTRVRGFPLSRCLDVLSDRDCEQIATELKDYLGQLRDIPNPSSLNNSISNTLGEACTDQRISGGRPVGPFPDEASFSQVLRFSDEPARRGHRIVFTHADLNPRNILVDKIARSDGTTGWGVTGIVDWETAGHYPEYWEYTKAMFEGFRWPRRYNDLIRGVFQEFGDYSKELDVERRSWESGDAV